MNQNYESKTPSRFIFIHQPPISNYQLLFTDHRSLLLVQTIRFQLNPQPIRQAIDKSIIPRHLINIQNRGVAKAQFAQCDDIAFYHFPGSQGEFFGVGEHLAVRITYPGVAPVGFECIYQCLVVGQAEQPGSVMT